MTFLGLLLVCLVAGAFAWGVVFLCGLCSYVVVFGVCRLILRLLK